jgi:hypothetical protein
MKINWLLVLVLTIFGCGKIEKSAQKSNSLYLTNRAREAMHSGRYFKDAKTNLCFFVVDSYQGNSITCVPCDSLVFVKIHTFNLE